MPTPFSPPLENPAWEKFAQARARGLASRPAAAVAGYTRPEDEGPRLKKRPQIVKRIEAIVEARRGGGSCEVGGLIDALIALAAKVAAETTDPRALDVARGALADAGRLKQLIRPDAPPTPPPRPSMTIAEWREKHDPTFVGGRT